MTKNVSVPEGYKKTGLGVLPEEWEVEELGTCIKQVKESVLPESTGKTIYVGLEHISSGETKLTNYGRSDSVKSLKFKFTKNNILYGKLRPYLDKAVLTDKEGICSTDIIVIECKDSSIKEFVIYILHSKQFLDYINGTTAGSNLPRTSWQSISKYKLPLPSFSEQQKIASILSKVDEQIEQTEQIIEKTELLKKGLMQKLLTKGIGHTKFKKTEIGEIPEEWSIVKQEEVVSFYNGRAYKLSEWEKTGTPVIRLQNLTGTGSEYYYSNLKLPLKHYVNKGDLLYMWSASFGPYIWNGPKAIFHYHIWKIECSDKMDKLFMYYLLNKTTELMKSKMNGMAILHITKSGMEKQKISLPPLPEQQKISSILSKVDFQIQDNQIYLSKLQELKKGLMQDLLTGKVRVCV